MDKKKTLILSASSTFDEAVSFFKKGGIIAYPTETFYGLGVDPFNKTAIANLFNLKSRSEKSPISVIIKDRAMLDSVAAEIPPVAEGLIKRFWPGPLTIIFKAHSSIPPELISYSKTIGVRVSSNPDTQKLLNTLNSPITATSANPSGKKPPVSAQEVLDYFDGQIDVLVDGGRLGGRLGSTIIDVTGKEIKVVREGEIPSGDLVP
ncbi:MAG: threonylcarbamoyl-AMP synthase [Deltaproteobacteria bacterium]|nr:threonylcarbamoyl-AMP synthase [Deltaproteobacteria bacterium]